MSEIIAELSRVQKSSRPYRDEDDDTPWPREIAVGNGLVVTISKKIDQLIRDVARSMRIRASLESQFTADDYRKLVRRAFGPALAKINPGLEHEQTAQSVLADVEASISEEIAWVLNSGGLEYAFGCTLFTFTDFPPFDIGPVRFEPREIWLDRKASDGRSARISRGGRIERFGHQIGDGPISKVAKRRILRAWRGQKPKGRKPSVDSHNERDIIEAIGDCPYVCSVKMPGFGDKAGQDKALLAARLALTTISLIWQIPSKALDGLNLLFDREMRGRSLLSFTSDGLILGGRMKSNMPHAPWVRREELERHSQEFSDEFAVAGEAIKWLLDPNGSNPRPQLSSIIAQAMIWFHDGCREVTDLKAIVSFASCMEILAGGDGQNSIRKLVLARLGADENTKIHRDGFTVREVIGQIYDEGRTRFIHGPRKKGNHVWGYKLGHDWSETRGNAELLARMCLVSCLEWSAENPQGDDPRLLLR